MGRVVKNARVGGERYVLGVPSLPAATPRVPLPAEPYELPSGFGGMPLFEDAPLEDAPLLAPPPVSEAETLRVRAQAVLDRAAADAEHLLAEAHSRARALIEDAASRTRDLEAAARAGGHDAGFAAGREAADREMNDMLATMRGLLEMARAERHQIISSAEPELVRLAFGIAERVLHQQVALDRGVVVEMAKNALARLIERDTVTVRVNPADLERMREHREELVALGDIRNLRVVEDQRVGRGGVVVDTDGGTIDARIGTQLEEVRKVLHIEDEVVVEPAPAGALAATPVTRAS